MIHHLKKPLKVIRKKFYSQSEDRWMERVEVKLFGLTILIENHFLQL